MSNYVNTLPHLTIPRVRTLVNELKKKLLVKKEELTLFKGAVNYPPKPLSAVDTSHFTKIEKGEYFAPRNANESTFSFDDEYNKDEFLWGNVWFKTELPPAKDDEKGKRVLVWHAHGETTLYVDRVPYGGIDGGHEYAPLPDEGGTVFLDAGTYSTGIWSPRYGKTTPDAFGFRYTEAYVAVRNENVWELYYKLRILLELAKTLVSNREVTDANDFGHITSFEACSPLGRKLVRELQDVLAVYEQEGARAATERVNKVYADYPAEYWQPTIAITAHSHLDLVWLWPEHVGIRKAVHTLATTLRMIERYPKSIFLMTQPHVLLEVKKREPALYDAVIARIKEGRIELTGGMAVEADTLIATGEAFARCITFGQEQIKEMRGEYSKNLWLLDVFGYNAAMPQVLSLTGITSFYTSKLGWNAVNKFPHNSFVWKGNDGSEVLTHFQVKMGYLPSVIDMQKGGKEYRQSDVHDETLEWVGYGDGGGGINDELCENIAAMESLVHVPHATYTTVEGYFDRLEKVRDALPVFEGEHYLEFHRGVYTTQSEHKRLYRKAERALQLREATRAILGQGPLSYDEWERVLFSQFHDAIPGSSIRSVYLELNDDLARTADEQHAKARDEWGAHARGGETIVFNPLLAERTVAVTLPNNKTNAACTQVVKGEEGEKTIALLSLPPCSSVPIATPPKDVPAITATPTLLDNGVLRATFNEEGALTAMTRAGKDVALSSGSYFATYHDNPASFDAWDIDHYTLGTEADRVETMPLSVVEEGKVRAALEGRATFGNGSSVTVRYTLVAGSPWLNVTATVSWNEEHRLLKFHMPTSFKGKYARYGAPFGSVLRPQIDGNMIEEAMWEVPASRWAVVTDDSGMTGAAMVTKAKYGFSARNGNMGLSLLRAPSDPDPKADKRYTGVAEHVIEFALGAYRVDDANRDAFPPLAAETLYGDIAVVPDASPLSSGFEFDAGETSLVPAWVLPAKSGGVVVRFHETLGRKGKATLRFPNRGDAYYIDFMENVLGDVERKGDSYTISYTPYKIISVLFTSVS